MGGKGPMADKGRKNGPMRLDQFLAEMGYGTRTQVKDIVKKGRVRMNGEAVKDCGPEGEPGIRYCRSGPGAGWRTPEWSTICPTSPQGVVSATEDRKYPTVVGLIREALRKDLFPVGRLDIDTEGLLLITNDGELAHNLLSPKSMWIRYIWPMCPGGAAGGCRKAVLRKESNWRTAP